MSVLAKSGPDTLFVAFADGKKRQIPMHWTDLRPVPMPLTKDGEPVVLTPDGLLALSALVAARCKKVGPVESSVRRAARDDHGTKAERAVGPGSVVEQAGSPRARGGARARKRGR